MRQAVFLDRDGVINRMVYNPEFGLIDSPANPDEFEVLPGVSKALLQIKRMNFLAIVISNQPGIAKGRFTVALHDAMSRKMEMQIGQEGAKLDGAYYCFHHPQAVLEEYRQKCDCRKPQPGLLLRAAQDWDIDLSKSYFVGDGLTDILAGELAGTQNILIATRKCYICEELARQEVRPQDVVGNLRQAVQAIQAIESGARHDASPNTFLPFQFVPRQHAIGQENPK